MLDKVPYEELLAPLLVEMPQPPWGGKETPPVDIYFYKIFKTSVVRSVYKRKRKYLLFLDKAALGGKFQNESVEYPPVPVWTVLGWNLRSLLQNNSLKTSGPTDLYHHRIFGRLLGRRVAWCLLLNIFTAMKTRTSRPETELGSLICFYVFLRSDLPRYNPVFLSMVSSIQI